jgi:hypothetical protein
MMIGRLATIGVALTVSAGVARAQPAPAEDPAKPQVQTFELVLRHAVEAGGQDFAKRLSANFPLLLWPNDAPVVNGVALHDLSLYVFNVQVPWINGQTIEFVNVMQNRERQRRPEPLGARPPVVATGTTAADPMTASPVIEAFNPEADYRGSVRSALITAIIENAVVLGLQPTETLVVVVARATDPMPVNTLYTSPSPKLLLQVSGADIEQFRQRHITRDEMKGRIKVRDF